jgi:type IV pilus assembly protein PilB
MRVSASKKTIGELLVRDNLINMEQLEQARKQQKQSGGKLTSALVQLGYVNDKELTEFLGRQHNLPTLDLQTFEIDPQAIATVPKSFCEKHKIIPVQKADRTLVVAFSDPTNLMAKDDLSQLTKCRIEMVVSSEGAINTAIEKYYAGSNRLQNIMSDLEQSEEAFADNQVEAEIVDQDTDQADGPIVKFVNAMLSEAIKSKASDIHIEPYERKFRVRFRIDGVLFEKTQPPPGAAAAIASRVKILSKMDIAERRRPQDGRIKVRLKNGQEVDFRVSCLPTLFGEKIVLRILDRRSLQTDMNKLGFEEEQLALFKKAIQLPQGMVLITGPTGSGKTTTIYSALAELNDKETNISTAEDPVEFNVEGINQVQINSEIGFGFPEALRAFLRQDPDVIMVGEIRDLETASIAYKAASTGHMVVSTLHTNDACSTVTRLMEMGIPPYIISDSTTLVTAQRLIKTVCKHCQIEDRVLPETLIQLGVLEAELAEFKKIVKGEGCSHCNNTGLQGRVAIQEVLPMTPEIKHAILRGSSHAELKKVAIEQVKMISLRRSAILKLKRGITSVDEVINSSVAD